MSKFFDLTGKTAVVVGGGSGLGLVIAKGLVECGAHVVIVGRNADRLTSVERELNRARPNSASSIRTDLSNEAAVSSLAKTLSERHRGIDIAVNSAGGNIRNPISRVTLDEWKSVLDGNLTGAFLFARAMYPLLKKSQSGRLIHIASIFSKVSFPDRTSYASSKGGMLALTRTLAVEWASDGITVNSISPGPFLTEINKPVLDNPENYRKFCERIPLKRFGNPEEVVTAALFLASPFSGYVTGADIPVDGGWTAS